LSRIIDIRRYVDPTGIPTLVLVDLQQEYTASPRALAVPQAAQALEHCREALAHARMMGFPVAFVRWTGQLPLFNAATRFSRWIEGFEPWGSDMIFERSKPSCYASAPFGEVMEFSSGNFVLAGFAGETACLATALDAFSRGHRFTFLADASASDPLDGASSNDVHQVVTKVIELYGNVLGTKIWISATSRTRRHRRVTHGSEHGYTA
jgi:nicotinamidase-related amidase